ncbi:AAA family ATPase [Maridesulfovibrio ferrireducens]|uniref:AAA family ATPase n=1 Tax=Maridesulfovibrio ferrireducens TaxID=246191 RepID=UPI001A354342|nr:AAA family ATPase [Maridesulfovibrio ferrireducens]MBI9112745.1 AAA family ATPase [Maridesulfovibrio ferrireducens]
MDLSDSKNYIESITLTNFRKFEDHKFEFHPQMTALIGNNATGKSSIIRALGLLLNTYLLRTDYYKSFGGIKDDDVRTTYFEQEGQVFSEPQIDPEVELCAKGYLHNKEVEWSRYLKDRGKYAHEVIDLAVNSRDLVSKGDDCDLPLILNYGVGRLWEKLKPKQKEIDKTGSRLATYENCLNPKSDHEKMVKWFKKLEMSAWQKKRTISGLECVRKSVVSCIPGVNCFYFDAGFDELMIQFEDGPLQPFSVLSDGYRNMIGMVADMAHRAARLNPHMGESANQSSGVVLIDEVDLHLHPKWQRSVIGDLRKTFPNIQFIITTHSPFILQSLSEGKVIDLNKIQEDDCCYDADLNAQSVEDIVEDLMGVDVPQRSKKLQEMFDAAIKYYDVLEKSKDVSPEYKEELKAKLDELSAPFSDNIAYHAFLERKRILAGMSDMDGEECGL